ncbi:MAG TPA: hypothetical protein VMF06_12480 [Candidatus Limnocylindria bacterium]|jgi:hypothetical protein|nr:hypothetical protein [Candidatus Limnocylindria bacterium]
MNNVYRLQQEIADTYISPKGALRLPTFNCVACDTEHWTTDPWYASIEMTKAQVMSIGPLPEKVSSYDEFCAVRQRVSLVLGIDLKWPPGSHLGAIPIEITRKHAAKGLSPRRLESGVEYIVAGLSGSLLSIRLARFLQTNGVAVRWGKVILRNKVTNYEYAVLEPEPRLVWTEAERQQWELKVCEICGSITKGKTGGTFKQKEFERSIFETGKVLVYGAEVPQFHLNEMMKALIESAEPKGLKFYKEGRFT